MRHTIRPDWLDNSHPFAPWNQEDMPDTPDFCASCQTESGHMTNIGSTVTPQLECDRCLVDNAELCGDWDAETIAAATRIGVPHPTEPNC